MRTRSLFRLPAKVSMKLEVSPTLHCPTTRVRGGFSLDECCWRAVWICQTKRRGLLLNRWAKLMASMPDFWQTVQSVVNVQHTGAC